MYRSFGIYAENSRNVEIKGKEQIMKEINRLHNVGDIVMINGGQSYGYVTQAA